jgi:phosphoenolpyruvate carboxykinase (ATP)
MLSAALSGALGDVSYTRDPIFGFEVPNRCPGVPDEVLNPSLSWPDEHEYQTRYRDLAARFNDNFRKFEDHTEPEIKASGPKI